MVSTMWFCHFGDLGCRRLTIGYITHEDDARGGLGRHFDEGVETRRSVEGKWVG